MAILRSCSHFYSRPYSLLRKSLLTRNSARSLSGFIISKSPWLQRGIEKNVLHVLPVTQFRISSYNASGDQRKSSQITNPLRVQSCMYHCISNRKQGNSFLLSSSLNIRPGQSHDRRNFSMSWLDNLAVTQAGWFRALAESRLVESLMGGLQEIHDSLNLPWWGAIIVSTVLMRGILTFPLAVYQVSW